MQRNEAESFTGDITLETIVSREALHGKEMDVLYFSSIPIRLVSAPVLLSPATGINFYLSIPTKTYRFSSANPCLFSTC